MIRRELIWRGAAVAAALLSVAALTHAADATPYEVLVRFGRWEEILAEPDHPDWMVLTRTFRHVARGIAFAANRVWPSA